MGSSPGSSSGFAVGSVEGRVAIQWVIVSRVPRRFSFLSNRSSHILDMLKIRTLSELYTRRPNKKKTESHLSSFRNNFSFKCHRRDSSPSSKDQALVFAVNDINFHPVHGTFSTCGSLALICPSVSVWLITNTRLWWYNSLLGQGCAHPPKMWPLIDDCMIGNLTIYFLAFDVQQGPISTTAFNRNGNIFAYAVSYDWFKGHSGMTPGSPNKIYLHSCKDEEVRKRAARKWILPFYILSTFCIPCIHSQSIPWQSPDDQMFFWQWVENSETTDQRETVNVVCRC